MWDSSATQWTDDLNQLYAEDPSIVSAMRESSHRILYAVANSSAMNGIDADTRIVEVTPWWQIALPALVVVILVLAVLSIARLVKGVKMKKAMK